jgi:hypothetical protein
LFYIVVFTFVKLLRVEVLMSATEINTRLLCQPDNQADICPTPQQIMDRAAGRVRDAIGDTGNQWLDVNPLECDIICGGAQHTALGNKVCMAKVTRLVVELKSNPIVETTATQQSPNS